MRTSSPSPRSPPSPSVPSSSELSSTAPEYWARIASFTALSGSAFLESLAAFWAAYAASLRRRSPSSNYLHVDRLHQPTLKSRRNVFTNMFCNLGFEVLILFSEVTLTLRARWTIIPVLRYGRQLRGQIKFLQSRCWWQRSSSCSLKVYSIFRICTIDTVDILCVVQCGSAQ